MSDSSLEDAMEMLGVDSEVTERALAAAFRRLSRKAHPDLPGGDEARQKELNSAHEIVRGTLFGKRALIPRQIREPLQRLERAVAAEQAMRKADQVSKKAKVRSLRRITNLKWTTLGAAGASGAIGWLADSQGTPLATLFPDGSPVSGALKLMAFVLGAVAAVLQYVTNARAQAIDTYTTDLDDKHFCAGELASALRYRNRAIITAADVGASQEILENWPIPRPLLGYFPLGRILILKSVGHGLLEELTAQEIKPNVEICYRVGFQPERFGPPPEECADGSARHGTSMSVLDAVGPLVVSLMFVVGLSWLTLFLFSTGHSVGGWLAGVGAVMFAGSTVAFAFDLVSARRRRRLAGLPEEQSKPSSAEAMIG